MGFSSENNLGLDVNCINLGDKPVLVTSEDETCKLEPSEACAISTGDAIKNNNLVFEVNCCDDFTDYLDNIEDFKILSDAANYATEVIDFSTLQKKWAEKGNYDAIKSILKKNDIDKKKY